MMKQLVILLLASALSAAGADSPVSARKVAVKKPAAEVVGLSVAKPRTGDKYGRSEARGLRAGTRVCFKIAMPDIFIVKLDTGAARLKTFADDKGTDLTPKKSRFGSRWLGWPDIDKDKHTCRFVVQNTKAVPAAGATALTVQADIVLICGADPKEGEQKNVALKAGSQVSIGPVAMKIKSAKDAGGGDDKFSVEFTSSTDLAGIRELTFLDSAGKKIEARKVSSGSWGMAGRMSYTRTYSLKRKIASATIRISYFRKMAKRTVPIDAKIAVGL